MAATNWIAACERPRWVSKDLWIPPWLQLREGKVPVIVVAPHGGRRLRPVRRGDGVNDLQTATIAAEIAERLDGHAILNHGLDRNRIDLNRTSAVAAKAPSVAALLHAVVASCQQSAGVPLVLFVHGWNMVLPCCDLGMGMREVEGRLFGVNPTLSRRCYDGPVSRLRTELAQRGLSAAIGRRYPASGADNLCQVFSGRFETHEDRNVTALSRLSREGKVDALQLELGIPLRWPGAQREALLEAVTVACSAAKPNEREPSAEVLLPSNGKGQGRPRAGWELPAIRKGWRNTKGLEAGYGLQGVLAEGRFGLFAGVEPAGRQSMAARFSLVDSEGPMFLLVGEGPWDSTPGMYSMEGLQWHTRQDGNTRVTLDATMIRYPDHTAYLDLERGLSRSRLVKGKGELHFEALGAGCGKLEGELEIDGLQVDVSHLAFAERGGRSGAGARLRLRALDGASAWSWDALPTGDSTLALPEHGDAAAGSETLYAPAEAGDTAALAEAVREQETADGGWPSGVAVARVVDADGAAPESIELLDSGRSVLAVAKVCSRVPVWRDAMPGLWARWTFGVLEWQGLGAQRLPGTFERLELFRDPSS